MLVPINSIKVGESIRANPERGLDDLINDIRRYGLTESLLVIDSELICGYRRYYACKKLGWERISVVTSREEQIKEWTQR